MSKTEFKVGETFQLGLVKVRVVKEDVNSCSKCIFNGTILCGNIYSLTGSCFSDKREDRQDVIFVKVED